MILDKLENIGLYADTSALLRPVADYIKSHDLHTLPDGRTEIDGDRLYVTISHSNTESWEDRKFEAHHNYIDVQCVLSGNEIMGYANVTGLELCGDYNPTKDMMLFDDPTHGSPLAVTEGMFVVFFPCDAHKPCCICERQMQVHKAVFKVKV